MMSDVNKCRVLVLLSTYNGEKYLVQQIDSILQQEACDVNLLVRDDGSTDHTIEILNDYQCQEKLTWYTGENLRPAKSFMNLLKYADQNYDFYAFSDQDDVWKKDKLSSAIKRIGGYSAPAIWCSNAELVDENLQPLGSFVNSFVPQYCLAGVITGGGVQGSTMVFNRALAKLFWNRELPMKVTMHDYYVSSVCLAVGGVIVYDDNSYMLYRQHGGNVLGVKKSLLSAVKNRASIILNKDSLFDISTVSREIITVYESEIPEQYVTLLKLISDYKRNIFSRIRLMKLSGIGNGRRNISIALRLGILLGKL